MYVSKLALDHFRSWSSCVFDFSPKINILLGSNGLGKTNIVESLEVISTGTSHRVSSLMPLIEINHNCATIRANVKDFNNTFNSNTLDSSNDLDETTFELSINLKGANRARINGKKSLYMKDIVGLVPCVSFTPRDQNLIVSDPTVRRTFIDQAGALLIPNYLPILQEYNHIAKQRSALLKSLSNNYSPNSMNNYNTVSDLEVWTAKFIETGIILTKLRKQIIELLNNVFSNIVKHLSNSSNFASIEYNPSFSEIDFSENDFEENNDNSIRLAISEHFQRIYNGEVARGYNLIGPHRDDFTILLNNYNAKEFASNGESWTLALALKMALFKSLEKKNGKKPIVILDDVFAQLDEFRRKQILEFAKNQDQVFITVASLSDIPKDKSVLENSIIDVSKIAKDQNEDDSKSLENNIDINHKILLENIVNSRKNSVDYIENNQNKSTDLGDIR
ncbi:DNA replication/repair protein RecF [Gardnerella pickettii]|uniref:DNA replication and repair protein RecF n=1 Tax=Gardnerella pickettii TaxID=2914924 RepID=A0ABX4SGZ1_9BIFI|nr:MULTISPECIES: DNA replication and repair protein RecF [Gardnerella]EIK86845.1 recombination protein RecF [Gardnerella pickettii 00703C2mash]PKZ54501.1 DNA replication and repair protein RecF [Gardnerella pickettii]RDW98399.1 DNA recombination protein RecF [Gardnerella vaginalis]RDW99853.1 DNA recombination protein RecF [Gardnerella vaginalis]UQA80204.1 DNA replication and repair protein RecF [Gardnerella vaginalis]